MKYAFYTAAGLLGLVIVGSMIVILLGVRLPEEQNKTVSVEIQAPIQKVWGLITDYSHYDQWWKEIKSTYQDTQVHDVWWFQDFEGNNTPIQNTEDSSNHKLTQKTASPKFPYTQTWELKIISINKTRTLLSIHEITQIKYPGYRAYSHYFLKPSQKLESFTESIRSFLKK